METNICSRNNCFRQVCSYYECCLCKKGICFECMNEYKELLDELTKSKVDNCNICRADFDSFCIRCKQLTHNLIKYYGYHKSPSEFVKLNFRFCDCTNKNHCTSIAREEIKNKLSIPLSLIQTNKLYCNHCFDSNTDDLYIL